MLNKKDIGSFDIAIKLFKLLSKKRRYEILILLILMVVSGFAEIFSIGSLVPFLGFLTNPDKISEFNFLGPIINFTNYDQKLIFLGGIFILLNFLSCLIRILNLYFTNLISAKIGLDISYKAFEKTIYQEYAYHIKSNSNEIISAITVNIQRVISGISAILQFISSIILCSSLIIALLIISWQTTILATITIGLLYLIVIKYTRKRLAYNSLTIAEKTTSQFKILQEGLGSIREIILSYLQENYLALFRKTDEKLRYSHFENNFILSYPRFLLEFLIIALLTFISVYLVLNNSESFVNLVPAIGAFALGSQRLVIYYQLTYSSWANIKSKSKPIETVLRAVNKIKKLNPPKSKFKNFKHYKFSKEISFNDVCFKYKKDIPFALNNFNLTIRKGEILGIIGLTGSGKSTFVDLFAGLLKPSKGKIIVDGYDIFSPKSKEIYFSWQDSLAYVPQDIFLFDDSIAANIVFGSSDKIIDKDMLIKALKVSQAYEFVSKLPLGINTLVGEKGIKLSGGQKQRINIARAIYKNKEILILDEATSALDMKTEQMVINSIINLKKKSTIIMISHRQITLNCCDRVIQIKNGNLLKT